MNREELERLMEQIAQLGEPPKKPRLMSWGSGIVALIALAAVVGSLGWSYADYKDRQEEWKRIAEEQTVLANQRAELANERAMLLKQSEDARAQLIAREVRLQANRRKWIDLTRQALAIEDPVELAVRVAHGADELLIDGPPSEQDMQSIVSFVEDLIRICKKKVESPDVSSKPAQ